MQTSAPKIVNRAADPRPAPAVQPVQVQATPARVQLASALRVSSPHDPAEREAERTARRVLDMPEPRTADPIGPRGAAPTLRSPYLARMAGGIVQREPAIARKQEGQPTVSSGLAAEIGASQATGSPLPPSARRFMEPRFGADFSNVRVHTGEPAARMSRQLNAQAFTLGNRIFFGRDKFQPDTQEGKALIAHELTHTIQQGGAAQDATVRRRQKVRVAERSSPQVQRLGLGDALNFFADKANLIPGFRMFTIILGMNPINMGRVDRSAANILRALIEFLPGGGLITQALETSGVFDKVGTWVEQQIRSLGMAGSAIKQAVTAFLDTLSWKDIFDLGGVWERAKRIFTEPIDRIINFAKGLITGIVQFVKDAILMPLAKLAEGTRGWDLLCAVLGKNPITADPVPRTAETLIGGFMKLVGQEDVWENMKKANAIGRAWAWFQGAMAALMGFVQQLPTLAINAFKALELADIVLVPRAFVKVAAVFGNFIGNFISWGLNAAWKLLEIVFDAVSPGALGYIKRTGAALKGILKNPLPFVRNLVKAAKLGFQNFAANFGGHLKAGLIDWLTGSLPGIYIPKAFSLQEIVKFVLSVLGLSWANVRQKLVKAVGETAVKAMETGFDIVVTLVTQGPAAAWDKIKDQLANLKDMVIGGITDFVIDMVAKKAVPKLIAMFIPGAGFISAILSIYDTVMVFVNKLSQIVQVVTGFIDSIVNIAAGAIGAAATRVETTLAGLLSLAINFLAGFIGLGKVADKVMGVIQKVRAPIDKALDWLVNWIVTMAKKFGKLVASKLTEWWKMKKTFSAGGESHSLTFAGEKRAARLLVASTPTPLPTFLNEKRAQAGLTGKQRTTLASIEAESKKIEVAQALPEDKYDQAQKDIEAATAVIVPLLVQLLSGNDYGSPTNPLPLEYTKRRAGQYREIYIGPRSKKTIKQELLGPKPDYNAINKIIGKDESDEWQARNKKAVVTYYPTKQAALPTGDTIGISLPFQVEVGLRVEYEAGKTKGGGKINKALDPFGYSAAAQYRDGDHIIEMQIGGPNELYNLWPLEAGENRSSGSMLKAAIEEAKKKVKPSPDASVNKDHFYLIISKTR